MYNKKNVSWGFWIAIGFLFTQILSLGAVENELLSDSILLYKQKINEEKNRLIDRYKENAVRVCIQTDTCIQFVDSISDMHSRFLYHKRLMIFLKGMDSYYTSDYLRSGRYLDALTYFPQLILWHKKGLSPDVLMQNRLLTIKAMQLIPSDSALEAFLMQELLYRPDDVLRNTDGFADRPFAGGLLEKIARDDPDAVKRYLGTDNNVNKLLSQSQDSVIRKIYAIFQSVGMKSTAFILLNDILERKLSIDEADSLQSYPHSLNDYLIRLMKSQNVIGKRSVQKSMMNYNIETARNLNNITLLQKRAITTKDLAIYTQEQLLLILIYGYREFTPVIYNNILQILTTRTDRRMEGTLIKNINQITLAGFLEFNDQTENLEKIFSLIDPASHDYLNALLLDPQEDMPNLVNKVTPTLAETYIKKPAIPKNISVPEIQVENPKPMHKVVLETFAIKHKNIYERPNIFYRKAIDIEKKELDEISTPTINIHFSAEERLKMQMFRTPQLTLQQVSEWINDPIAEEILLYMAEIVPDELLKKTEYFRQKSFAVYVVEKAALIAPISARRYLYNPNHPVSILLQQSVNPGVNLLLQFHSRMTQQGRALCMLDEVSRGNITIGEAIERSTQADLFFKNLLQNSLKNRTFGTYSLEREMNPYCLKILRDINNRIAINDPNAFEKVENMNAGELLAIMVNGREEVYAKNLQGLLSRFTRRLQNNKTEYFEQNTTDLNFRKFISLCGSNGALPQLMQSFSEEETEKMLRKMVSGLEKTSLQEVVMVGECLVNTNDTRCNKYLHYYLKEEFERVVAIEHTKGISMYGLLISLISDRAAGESEWFRKIGQQFISEKISDLQIQELMGHRKLCVEQIFFYNDEDGIASYKNFLRSFSNQPEWTIDDRYSFIVISSNRGNAMEIYANKPEFERNGIAAVRDYLSTSGKEPQITIHRGYSLHTQHTIAALNKHCRLVFLGSCGGFYQIASAMNNAPDAQFIATKQIGTLHINDPILYAINEKIRNNQNLEWVTFWKEMESKLNTNPLFFDYIPPHRNLESLLCKAFYRLLES